MAEPETLAELGERGQHALEVFLRWCRKGHSGPLTFHFRHGEPKEVEATRKVPLGGNSEDGPLTVLD